MNEPKPTGGGVRVASVLKKESVFIKTDSQMNMTGQIKSAENMSPADRLKERRERILRIQQARNGNVDFEPIKPEEM